MVNAKFSYLDINRNSKIFSGIWSLTC